MYSFFPKLPSIIILVNVILFIQIQKMGQLAKLSIPFCLVDIFCRAVLITMRFKTHVGGCQLAIYYDSVKIIIKYSEQFTDLSAHLLGIQIRHIPGTPHIMFYSIFHRHTARTSFTLTFVHVCIATVSIIIETCYTPYVLYVVDYVR